MANSADNTGNLSSTFSWVLFLQTGTHFPAGNQQFLFCSVVLYLGKRNSETMACSFVSLKWDASFKVPDREESVSLVTLSKVQVSPLVPYVPLLLHCGVGYFPLDGALCER